MLARRMLSGIEPAQPEKARKNELGSPSPSRNEISGAIFTLLPRLVVPTLIYGLYPLVSATASDEDGPAAGRTPKTARYQTVRS